MITFDPQQEQESRWRWFEFNAGGKRAFSVELYNRTSEEAEALGKRVGGDERKRRALIAEHWFRDFRGIAGPDGQPLENTLENRRALLNEVLFWTFVQSSLMSLDAWYAEGNADSGSV